MRKDLLRVEFMGGQFLLYPGLVETASIYGNGTRPSDMKLKLPPFMYGEQCLMDLDDFVEIIGAKKIVAGNSISIQRPDHG